MACGDKNGVLAGIAGLRVDAGVEVQAQVADQFAVMAQGALQQAPSALTRYKLCVIWVQAQAVPMLFGLKPVLGVQRAQLVLNICKTLTFDDLVAMLQWSKLGDVET